MDRLSRWFARQARRDERVRYLEDALLGDSWWPYAWFRLRYFTVRCAAAMAVQSLQFLFLFYTFGRSTFVVLVFATACASFATSFWWGALEHMRARIRRLYRASKPHLISSEISRWLRLAAWLALGILATAVGLAAGAMLRSGARFGLAHFYGIAILLRVALEVVTRTLHSGVYAIRRVYRPVPAIVLVELASFVPVLLLWPVVGAWAFPSALIVGSLTSAALTVHYTLGAYRFLGIEPLPARRRGNGGLGLSWGAAGEFFAAGSSYALMKMDAFLVLLFLVASGRTESGLDLVVLFFVVTPLVRAAFDWAQLFYFDFKRLEVRLLELVRRRYERHVFHLALLIGVMLWALASLIGTAAARTSLGTLYLVLAPFFLSRTLLAFVQIRMFSTGQYRALLKISFLLLAAFVPIALGVSAPGGRLVVIAAATFGTLGLLRYGNDAMSAGPRGEPVDVLEWLALLREAQRPVRVGWVRVMPPRSLRGEAENRKPGRARWVSAHVAAQIARRLRAAGAVAIGPSETIVWHEPSGSTPRVSDRWLTWLTAGGSVGAGGSIVHPDGASAADAPQTLGLLRPGRSGRSTPEATVSVAAMRRAFAERFPEGTIYAPDEPADDRLRSLPRPERRGILGEACRFVRGRTDRRRPSPFDVTALCIAGRLRLIFLLDRRLPRRRRSRWRMFVHEANLRAADARFWTTP